MKITEFKGNTKTRLNIDNLAGRTRSAIRMTAYRHGKQLQAHAKKEILKKGRTGRVYKIRRGATFRNHQASAPGEYPASISGALWRSLGFNVKGWDTLEFGAGKNGSPASKYARILELGGRAGRGKRSKIEPRKYLLQTIQAKEKDLTTGLRTEIGKFARGLG
jgi:phage gpG-like protein